MSAGAHRDDDGRGLFELDLASRIADRAVQELDEESVVSPAEEVTWATGADEDYRVALDEITTLVQMRRTAVALNSDFSEDDSGHGAGWGPFELLDRLGGGASGEVYKVRDNHLRSVVALKLFHRERVDTDELDSLLVEGRQHALVNHPNIAVIHGADENDGRAGIWMEYIDGATLHALVRDQGTFGAAEAANIGRELCAALAEVHHQGLTHGDIKAQNVMREKGGRIVLMDFSSSRVVEVDEEGAGGLLGTPIYMAPELFERRPQDYRSDIYALGVLLFFLVTGRHPYEANNLKTLKQRIQSKKPLRLDDARPGLAPAFVHAIEKATAWEPGDRFDSAAQFHGALRDAIEPREVARRDFETTVVTSKIVTWSALAVGFLALLGLANELVYGAVLHIPASFADVSLGGAIIVGFRSLVTWTVLMVTELVPVALVWGLVSARAPGAAGARRLRHAGRGLVRRGSGSVWFAIACIGGVAASCFVFRDFLSVLAFLAETPPPHRIDTSLLAGGYPEGYLLALSQLCVLMVAGWVSIYRARGDRWALRVAAFAILAGFAVMSAPWRITAGNAAPPVSIDGRTGYLVAENEASWFVYIPHGEPVVIPSGSVPLGETPVNIFGR